MPGHSRSSHPVSGLALCVAVATAALFVRPGAAAAQIQFPQASIGEVVAGHEETQTYVMNLGRGQLIRLPRAISSLFVTDPEIIDVSLKAPDLLYMIGKSLGETNFYALDEAGNVAIDVVLRVEGSVNVAYVERMLQAMAPGSDISVRNINGIVVLSGTATSPGEVDNIMAHARRLVGENRVVNQLRLSHSNQVQIKVIFAEVSRSVSRNIGFSFTGTDPGGGGIQFGISSGVNASTEARAEGGASGITLALGARRVLGGVFDITTVLDLLEKDDLISTLSEPTLTAISGQEASFRSGNEYPIITLDQSDAGTVTREITFKEYGIDIAFTPTILSTGRIRLRVHPSFSQLATGVIIDGYNIPGLSIREASTEVELASGQAMAIAGLIHAADRNGLEQTPGLSEIPVLGSLFRRTTFAREESELLVVVIPYLVRGIDGLDNVRLPQDGLRTPTDYQRMVEGKLYTDSPVSGGRPASALSSPSVGFILK